MDKCCGKRVYKCRETSTSACLPELGFSTTKSRLRGAGGSPIVTEVVDAIERDRGAPKPPATHPWAGTSEGTDPKEGGRACGRRHRNGSLTL